MSNLLKTNLEQFAISVAEHLNYIHSLIGDSVSSETHNTAIETLNQIINDFRQSITNMETKTNKIDGIKFIADQSKNIIYLKNKEDEILTQIDVAFLNNEGTKFVYNSETKSIDLKNDSEQLLSSIPLTSFISGLPINLSFNNDTKYKLELKSTEGNVVSSVEITPENIKGLQSLLNNISNIYTTDGSITGKRTINFDETIEFVKGEDKIIFDESSVTLQKLVTDLFNISKSKELVVAENYDTTKAKLRVGNTDIDRLEITAKSIVPNLDVLSNTPKGMVAIDTEGKLCYVSGGLQNLTAGEGLVIENGVIRLADHDSISLVFNW